MNLHEDLQTLPALIESLAEGVIVADQSGRFRYFNRVAEEILGVGLLEVSPEEWSRTYGVFRPDGFTPFPPEELPLARAIAGEEVREELLFIRNPERSGGVFIRVTASPIRDDSGTLSGGTVIFRDVTRSVRREEKLRQLSNAVEQGADAVIITDRAGLIEYVNPAFEGITGYRREEVLGRKPGLLKSGRHDDDFYRAMWSTLRNGDPWQGTVLNRRKDDVTWWSQQTITPIKDHEGEITHFVSVARDITDFLERERHETRMQVAREIQQRLYHDSIDVPGFDIAGVSHSAEETNGDYFDFLSTPDGRIWLILGDVCSHGVGSALIMAQIRAYIRALALEGHEPGVVLQRLNAELVDDLDPYHYVTLVLVRIDPEGRSLEYINAGHPSAYLLGSSGAVRLEMESQRVPLGFLPDQDFPRSESIPLEKGDTVLLLSDGLLEAGDETEEMYGPDRAMEAVRSRLDDEAKEIVSHLCRSVREFSGDIPQEDDITVVVVRVTGEV